MSSEFIHRKLSRRDLFRISAAGIGSAGFGMLGGISGNFVKESLKGENQPQLAQVSSESPRSPEPFNSEPNLPPIERLKQTVDLFDDIFRTATTGIDRRMGPIDSGTLEIQVNHGDMIAIARLKETIFQNSSVRVDRTDRAILFTNNPQSDAFTEAQGMIVTTQTLYTYFENKMPTSHLLVQGKNYLGEIKTLLEEKEEVDLTRATDILNTVQDVVNRYVNGGRPRA